MFTQEKASPLPLPAEANVLFSPETLTFDIQTETLDVLAMAKNYNQWIFDSFSAYLGDSVLEIGCGIGTYTEMFLQHASHVTALDTMPDYVRTLQQKVKAPSGKILDARCQNVLETTEGLGKYDSIVMLNVLEHIQDDLGTLQTLRGLLNPGGRLILLVPALQFLYSDYDRAVHHYRRYDKTRLNSLLTGSGYAVSSLKYFNLIGIFGWWFNFCLSRKTEMSPGSVSVFEKLVPVVRTLENIIPPPVGLSLISIARA